MMLQCFSRGQRMTTKPKLEPSRFNILTPERQGLSICSSRVQGTGSRASHILKIFLTKSSQKCSFCQKRHAKLMLLKVEPQICPFLAEKKKVLRHTGPRPKCDPHICCCFLRTENNVQYYVFIRSIYRV